MIHVQNLSLVIEKNVILDDVSFSIQKGQYVGLIGPNGAGKTSLIKTILGLYKATKGSIKMDPNIVIGYVPQHYQISDIIPLSVQEVLAMSRETNKKLFAENLHKVGLGKEFLSKNFHTLSGGQKQRVIIARAMCQQPDILIFDEPLNGVDYKTKLSLYVLLSRLNKQEQLTILFVSHEVDHIMSQCHHILCLNTTMHTGCHPLTFAKEKGPCCPTLDDLPKTVPVHHHQKTKCC